MSLDELAHLADLVWLGEATKGLQVHDFSDPRPRKDVMTAADALIETEAEENRAEIIEVKVALDEPGLQPIPELVDACHNVNLPIHDMGGPSRS